MTNADKIRSMTDEQLAEFLASLMPSLCDYCKAKEDAFFFCHLDCKRGWETWLKDTQNTLWRKHETQDKQPLQ